MRLADCQATRRACARSFLLARRRVTHPRARPRRPQRAAVRCALDTSRSPGWIEPSPCLRSARGTWPERRVRGYLYRCRGWTTYSTVSFGLLLAEANVAQL